MSQGKGQCVSETLSRALSSSYLWPSAAGDVLQHIAVSTVQWCILKRCVLDCPVAKYYGQYTFRCILNEWNLYFMLRQLKRKMNNLLWLILQRQSSAWLVRGADMVCEQHGRIQFSVRYGSRIGPHFVSVPRSRRGTPAAAWMSALPPHPQLVTTWSHCIRTTGQPFCSAKTMCSYSR